MTQPDKSAHNRPSQRTQGLTKRRFASTLPAQSLGWLSSVSLLSGGFVFAQTESSVKITVPTVENSQPQKVTTKSKPSFAERRARLKQKLKQRRVVRKKTEVVPKSPSKAKKKSPAVTTIRTRKAQVRKSSTKKKSPAVTIRTRKTQVGKSPVRKVKTPTATKLRVPAKVAQPARRRETIGGATTSKVKDYNNSYIDPTEYKAPRTRTASRTRKYQPPSSVVVKDRSTGCEAIFSKREIAGGACSRKAPKTPTVANAPKKSVPSWIKKSETPRYKTVPAKTKVAVTSKPKPKNNVVKAVATAVNRKQTWRATNPQAVSRSSTKSSSRRNRFIPKPSEFASTKRVNTVPVAPSFGTLPAPMTEGNVAPRPSQVSYDFALASVLPQIPYRSTVAYGNSSGIMFPLSFAAPVTSLFGWRIHPITGNRRFHAGTDMGAPTGTPILAAAKGQVEIADWLGGYGLTVTINHSSAQQTLYAHMSEILVRPGQLVEPGMVIGRVGNTGNSTGPHLHFEVRHLTSNGWVAVDPGVKLQAGLNNLLYSRNNTNNTKNYQ
ncbi:MAG: M23 family metallopeptidase [Sphaerospermopsis sp. SIO1G2]|nr:M23 family metallopeptidase [Sphaerospermopsis sp. SIO1G2]